MSVREFLPTKRAIAFAVVVILLFSSVGAATAASTMNFNASAAHNAHIAVDVTKSTHPMSWGTDDAAAVKYEANDGDVVSAPASVNRSMDVDDIGTGHVNPYAFTVTDVEFQDATAFPHDKEEVSAVANASEWSLIGPNSSKASVASVETANNVDALEIATDGSMASGDVAGAEFTNFSVTSDVDKRYLQLALDVTTLDSGATVTVRAKDADGDYVQAEINGSATASNENVIANATGEGFVYQRQIGQMTVSGSGDGTMAEIQEIEIRVNDADATIRMSALNVEKTGKWNLGEERVDTDDEDDFETNTIYEVHSGGDISVHSLSTLGPTFDSATIHELTIPMNFEERKLQAESDFSVNFTRASAYPAFDWKVGTYSRLSLRDAYDLSYANARLEDTAAVPAGRYIVVEYKEGVSDTDFQDIDNWNSVTGSYDSQGADVTIDGTIQPGQEIALHRVYTVTSDEKSALQNIGAGGGGGGFFGAASGGLQSIWGAIAGAAAGVLALVGNYIRKLRSGV